MWSRLYLKLLHKQTMQKIILYSPTWRDTHLVRRGALISCCFRPLACCGEPCRHGSSHLLKQTHTHTDRLFNKHTHTHTKEGKSLDWQLILKWYLCTCPLRTKRYQPSTDTVLKLIDPFDGQTTRLWEREVYSNSNVCIVWVFCATEQEDYFPY